VEANFWSRFKKPYVPAVVMRVVLFDQ